MNADPLQKAEELLISARLGDCLQQLRELLTLANAHEAHDDAFLLLAQYNKYSSDERRGLLSVADAQLTLNRLNHRTLQLIAALRQQPDLLAPYLDTQARLSEVQRRKPSSNNPTWLPAVVEARMARVRENAIDFTALWLDDSAISQRIEATLIRDLGVSLTVVESTTEFRAALQTHDYHLHLSCIDLERESHLNGLQWHQRLVQEGIDRPTIFYIGYTKREYGVPPYAFGITNSPVGLLHLVMDVMERHS